MGIVLCKGRSVYFFIMLCGIRQVSGILGDSGVEFGKESGTRCCQGMLQTFGLFCSPKVICLLIIVPFFLHQPCEIWALGLHASSQSDEGFFFSLLYGPVTYYACDYICFL